MSAQFCTTCGQPILLQNALACGNCGKPLPTTAPPATSVAHEVEAPVDNLDVTTYRATPYVTSVEPAAPATSPPVPPSAPPVEQAPVYAPPPVEEAPAYTPPPVEPEPVYATEAPPAEAAPAEAWPGAGFAVAPPPVAPATHAAPANPLAGLNLPAGVTPQAWGAVALLGLGFAWGAIALLDLQLKAFDQMGDYGNTLRGLAYTELPLVPVLIVEVLLAATAALLITRSKLAKPVAIGVTGFLIGHAFLSLVAVHINQVPWMSQDEYGRAGVGYGGIPPWWLVAFALGAVLTLVLLPGAVEPGDEEEPVRVRDASFGVARIAAVVGGVGLVASALLVCLALLTDIQFATILITLPVLAGGALLVVAGITDKARGPLLLGALAPVVLAGLVGGLWREDYFIGYLGEGFWLIGLAALPILVAPRTFAASFSGSGSGATGYVPPAYPAYPAAPSYDEQLPQAYGTPPPAQPVAPQAYQPAYPQAHQPAYQQGYQQGYPQAYPPGYAVAPVRVDSRDPRLKSSFPTILITFLFGLAGIAAASIQTSNARKRGLDSNRYWKAFLITQITGFVLWVGFWIAIIAWLNSVSTTTY